jgi:hypothetical protein
MTFMYNGRNDIAEPVIHLLLNQIEEGKRSALSWKTLSILSVAESDDITEDWEMPRVGRRLSDGEIVTLLATQKGVDGAKYRFSANEIYALVKGPRRGAGADQGDP